MHLAADLLSAQVGVAQLDLDGSEALSTDNDFANEVALSVVGQRQLGAGIDTRLNDLAAGIATHLDVHPGIGRRRWSSTEHTLEKIDYTPHSVSHSPI